MKAKSSREMKEQSMRMSPLVIYYVILGAFALMPLLVARR
jgi:hypothetical protein